MRFGILNSILSKHTSLLLDPCTADLYILAGPVEENQSLTFKMALLIPHMYFNTKVAYSLKLESLKCLEKCKGQADLEVGVSKKGKHFTLSTNITFWRKALF